MRRYRLVFASLLLVLAAVAPPMASAAAGHATLDGTFDQSDGSGTFTVLSGPLLAVCSGGLTQDEPAAFAGAPQSGRVQLLVLKHFYCDEGPTFDMQLTVRVDFEPEFAIKFTWEVRPGSGSLTGLHGAGTGFGDLDGDHYSGTMILN